MIKVNSNNEIKTAVKTYLSSYKLSKVKNGINHMTTISCMKDIAQVYLQIKAYADFQKEQKFQRKGDIERTIEYVQRCYQSLYQIYGQHNEIIKVVDLLVISYIQILDFHQALKFNLQSYCISLEAYGLLHLHTIRC